MVVLLEISSSGRDGIEAETNTTLQNADDDNQNCRWANSQTINIS